MKSQREILTLLTLQYNPVSFEDRVCKKKPLKINQKLNEQSLKKEFKSKENILKQSREYRQEKKE